MKKLALITIITTLSACSMQSSKSVSGIYQGTLPCADCEKIQAKLILNHDKTYQYDTVYFKNKKRHPFSEKGTYSWDAQKSNVIRLNHSGNLALQINADYVELCDSKGNVVASKNNYKLHKVQ